MFYNSVRKIFSIYWFYDLYKGLIGLYQKSEVSLMQAIPRPEPLSRVLSPSFLAGEWVLDLISQDGFEKMKEIVADILTHTENV